MGHSLSKEAQAVLEAAEAGDAEVLRQHSAGEPARITSSVTLLKRRGVLHLAAKQGHSNIIHAVLEPLLEAVRDEYYAHQQEKTDAADVRHPEPRAPQQPEQQGSGAQQPVEPAQQLTPQQQGQQQGGQLAQELQLVSFKKLRLTVNARDVYRRTPLIVAAKQGHLDCTQLLVEAASNLFAVDREGNTSLHYAALHGHALVTEYLLQKAADRGLGTRFVNKRNLSGFSALHYAVWSCSDGVVQQLLAAGADASLVNDRVFDAWVPVPVGSTPLHLAVMRNHVPISLQILQHYVMQLVTAGSDEPRPRDPRCIVNLYGMTPAQLAGHRNYRQLARLLMPSLSLARVLEALEPDAPRAYGPPSLKSIAAAVMQEHLTAQLEQLQEAQHVDEQQQQQQPAVSAAAAEAKQQCGRGECSLDAAACGGCSAAPAGGAGGGLGAAGRQVSCCSADSAVCGVDLEIIEGDQAEPQPSTPAARSSRCCQGCSSAESAAAAEAAASSAGGSVAGDIAAGPALSTARTSGWYDELCCVCWEESVTITMDPCLHALCRTCAVQLVAAAAAGATCPLCRGWIAGFGLVPETGPCAGAAGVKSKKMALVLGAGI